jgi:LPXTG-motif cell wall-anchored protein
VSNENDSRSSNGPSVENPNVIAPASSENAANVGAAAANTAQPTNVLGSAAANAEPFEFGVQEFGSPAPTSKARVTSLGEIARYYRTHHRQAVRTFNNDSIARLTTTGLPFETLGSNATVASNASPANAAGTATAPGTIVQPSATLMAQNQPPALPQSDQDSLGAQSNRPIAQSTTAAQQRHPSVQAQPVSAESSATPTTSNPQASNNTAAAPKSKPPNLPQTGSSLPLLLLLGGAGLAGGTLWLLRR